ncbi:oligodendrocyte-myelin glycoprotein [Hemiscyllium ocellatum]|uniref:oligodendrocyte-myelin glycoprotein n=1 Tax=Hemiscyllium ocellatum TaxID=170820 RepID=UPI002965FA4A|nr:oligodendrocyte-myelin glycoprotein [Hemiscyllium ocellatum]
MDYFKFSSCILALLSTLSSAAATCPSECLCRQNDRYVDCSGQGLTELPENIQDNITHLNISHNGIKDLSNKLTNFTNLRLLDMSNNLLTRMPTEFPRALWEIYAANNLIKVLEKEDTVTQWNLKILDLSDNLIERAFLINNTLINLKFLNVSGNRFWTVPTNTPYNLETLDLSHNNLQNILPDTFRQKRLSKLYLNNNSFTFIPNGTFDQLTGLQLITLYGNLWECNNLDHISYLLTWTKSATATVLGVPCTKETESTQKATITSDPSTMTLPTHTSSFTHQQAKIRTTPTTASNGNEAKTLQSFVSQGTETSSFLQKIKNASLNSPERSSVSEPVLEITTQSITTQTSGRTESSSNPPIVTNTTDILPASSMLITAAQFTSNSTISTLFITMADRSGTLNSQINGSMPLSTFEPMPTASHRPTASVTFSTYSEPSIINATTSHAAMRSISSTIKNNPTNLTTSPKVNGITGTTNVMKYNATTADSTNSKAHECIGITLYIMAFPMLVALVI